MYHTTPTLMLTMSLHGFTHSGSDICGHIFDANLELCQRWTTLGAFYTFSRSHNSRDNHRQDPAYWVISGKDEDFAEMTKKIYHFRYSLLPYLYTLMHQGSTTGATVSRALFHKYPWDIEARKVNYQFLWGDGVMIVPCVYPTRNPIYKLKSRDESLDFENCQVRSYFPDSRHYRADSYQEIVEKGVWKDIDLDSHSIGVYFLGGSVIARHGFYDNFMSLNDSDVVLPIIRNTNDARNSGISIDAFLDEFFYSKGDLYWDDGTVKLGNAIEDIYFVHFETERIKNKQVFHSELDKDKSKVGGLIKSEQLRLWKLRIVGVENSLIEKSLDVKIKINDEIFTDYSIGSNFIELMFFEYYFYVTDDLVVEIE